MAKKSRTDILEKLSALKPSEPTKTRGKSSRKPAARKVKVKTAAPAKRPVVQAPPEPEIPFPRYTGFMIWGDASKVYMGVYERWFKMITDTNSVLSGYNNMLVDNLTSLWDFSKWRRY
ncbi:MAG TPA: hypothetical protein VMB77_04830 [Syntrophales bacterium]|nr:hypothetical protein [Syntrophales bacterium]